MPNYKKMYLILFNAITDALEALDAQKFALASKILIDAQRHTEVMYIDAYEDRAEQP